MGLTYSSLPVSTGLGRISQVPDFQGIQLVLRQQYLPTAGCSQGPGSTSRPSRGPQSTGSQAAVSAVLVGCQCKFGRRRLKRAAGSALKAQSAPRPSPPTAVKDAEDFDSSDVLPGSELESMMSELRTLEASRGSEGSEDSEDSVVVAEADDATAIEPVDVTQIERSGQIAVLGVPNSGKSSLVNALVGAKVSIVSPKPQTTRQRILGLALLAPTVDSAPTTQAVFADTAGIMEVGESVSEFAFRHKRKRLFRQTRLHKAMVKTAWKQTRASDALFWVLDASKCLAYGDYMPACAELDGVSIGPAVEDSWWLHPELAEELSFLRRLRRLNAKVNVVLNKVDLLRDMHVDVEAFVSQMKDVLVRDLGVDANDEVLLQNLWPTSVLKDPESLDPIKLWLCENLPKQSPIYPVESLSDVPARVAASEITREKLFNVLREEVPYQIAVTNVVWQEEADGMLRLGQRVIVNNEGQVKIVRAWLRQVTEEAEAEISEIVNLGRPVELHFQIQVDPKWQEKEDYYQDLQGLLDRSGSLLFPQ
ncbi:GTPase Era [Symbiodinium microadriaticum]|uniref:GTPase Era n=1 Tax=Symbiodinium microadriaticum TaxID=2951 RepID=A0A1Q9EK71_SYMMI|nr:GTPase Era [Symbiodinium microadriaticum]CAE7344540.1 era [Symbiodinium microadriaticum]CAE7929225.1 era [Symbiodinium sp. KB8]